MNLSSVKILNRTIGNFLEDIKRKNGNNIYVFVDFLIHSNLNDGFTCLHMYICSSYFRLDRFYK